MKPEDRVRFAHMIEAAQLAMRFMAGRTRADLDADPMLLFAVVRAIEVIGEVASRVSSEARAAAAGVPWPAVIGMRNRLVHAYFGIGRQAMWKNRDRGAAAACDRAREGTGHKVGTVAPSLLYVRVADGFGG